MKKLKAKYVLYVFVCLLIAAAAILEYTSYRNESAQPQHMRFIGSYSTDGQQWIELESGNQLKKINTDEIYIKGHFNESIKNGEYLWGQFQNSEVTFSKNDKIIYTNKNNPDREKIPFIREWVGFMPGELSSADELVIHINGDNAGICAGKGLDSLSGCDKIDLLRANLRKHILQICIAVFVISIGIALALTVIALCVTNKRIYKSYVFSGMFLIAGGICTIIDYDYITLLIADKLIVNNIDYISQCLICEFLMLYISAFLKSKVLKRISFIFSVLMFVLIIGYFVFPFNMFEYVKVQIPLFFSGIAIAAMFLLYEYFNLCNIRIRPLLISGAIVSIFIAAEMIHYYITGEYWIVVFQFGLIVYACMQFYYLVVQAGETIKDAQSTESVRRELAEAKIEIMLSQIRPHFIYNALTAISSLCKTNPKEADKATCEFAVYLRSNLESLNRTKPIIFLDELEHIENYLKLEKRRFTDRLNVSYNIQSKVFRIPALTVQPIVENAVKHGICARETPGNVEISSYETDTDYVVEVKDDGVGFDVNKLKNDGKTHIGISNIKSRLNSMVKGTLTIESEIGRGTRAVVKIPKGL